MYDNLFQNEVLFDCLGKSWKCNKRDIFEGLLGCHFEGLTDAIKEENITPVIQVC